MVELAPGQKLVMVMASHTRNGPGLYEVEVDRVARKWAYLKGNYGRIDRLTLAADGGDYSSPGKCYLSRAEYETELAADRAWNAFRLKAGYLQRPAGLSAETIAEAAALLGIALPKNAADV